MKNIIVFLMIIGIGLAFGPQLHACDGGGTGGMMDMSSQHGSMMTGHQGSGVTDHTMGGHGGSSHTGATHHTPTTHTAQSQHHDTISQDQARNLVEEYLRSTNNQDLRVKRIWEADDSYEVVVVESNGTVVDRIKVDKESGTLHSVVD